MPDTDVATESTRPPGLIGLLRRHWLIVLIPILLAPAAAYAFSSAQEKEYEAQTSVLISDSTNLASADPGREAATNLRLLQLEDLEQRVENRLGGQLRASVDVFAEEDSNLATIAVTAENPERAADVANAYAREFIGLRKEVRGEEIEQERAAVEEQLADLSSSERSGTEGLALQERLQELALAESSNAGVRQFGRAEPPENESSPQPARATAIGLLIGIVLGVAGAIAVERRDRRLRDQSHIQAVFGHPLVGRIPVTRGFAKSGPSVGTPPPEAAEAFRTLRANLQFLLRDRPAQSVLITSPSAGDGKTTIAWNLARAEAAYGTRVLLVEADMRHPVLAKAVGGEGSRGLAEFLRQEGTLEEIVESIPVTDSEGNETATVDVLFAGEPPNNPAELLDTKRMTAMLETLPEAYDLLVIDTPPTAVVSDAMPLLSRVGAVLVVARMRATPYELMVKLRDQLEQLQAPVLGVVANGTEVDAASNKYYSSSARKVPA